MEAVIKVCIFGILMGGGLGADPEIFPVSMFKHFPAKGPNDPCADVPPPSQLTYSDEICGNVRNFHSIGGLQEPVGWKEECVCLAVNGPAAGRSQFRAFCAERRWRSYFSSFCVAVSGDGEWLSREISSVAANAASRFKVQLNREIQAELAEEVRQLRTEFQSERAELARDLQEDLRELQAELAEEARELTAEFQRERAELARDLQEELKGLQAELAEEARELTSEFQREMAELARDLQQGLKGLQAELAEEARELTAEFQRERVELARDLQQELKEREAESQSERRESEQEFREIQAEVGKEARRLRAELQSKRAELASSSAFN